MRNQHRHPPASRSRHNIGNSALPPLPPSINARSHSLDGLLEPSGKMHTWAASTRTGPSANMTAEGLNKINIRNNAVEKRSMTEPINQSDGGSKETIKKTVNRRSKSLDDLLDDDQLIIVEDERETQSMENILEKTGDKVASNESINCSMPSISTEKMCENEVITVENSMLLVVPDDNKISHNDSGIHFDSEDTLKLQSDASSFDEDTVSNTISLTSSTASERKSGKTFLNKYVKKVKNLMKK